MTMGSAAGLTTAAATRTTAGSGSERGSRIATGVRIAAGAAGVPLPGLHRPPRLPLAIGALVAGVAALGAMFLLLMLMTLVGAGGLGSLAGTTRTVEETDGPSALAKAEIPPEYLRLYQAGGAALRPGLGDPGGDRQGRVRPRARPRSVVHAGGRRSTRLGPAGRCSSWPRPGRRTGWTRDGDGAPDRWNPADAIFGAANYLQASGAPGDYRKAIFAYNHAEWYVDEVESWAARYRGPRTPPAVSPARGSGGGRPGGHGHAPGERNLDAGAVHRGRAGGALARATATWR